MEYKKVKRNRYKKQPKKKIRIIKIIPVIKKVIEPAFKSLMFITIIAVISLLFIFCNDLVTQHKYFNTNDIEINGLKKITYEEIIEQAKIWQGINILKVNTSLVRKRLLAHPWVKEVDIIRELPGRLIINIKEQQKLAVVDIGQSYMINTNGEIFKKYNKEDQDKLPLITGLTLSDVYGNDKINQMPYKAVIQVLTLGSSSDTILPNQSIHNIIVDKDIGLTINAFEPRKTIKIGYNSYELKYKFLKNIIQYLKNSNMENIPCFEDVDSIDLNTSNIVIVSTQICNQSQKG